MKSEYLFLLRRRLWMLLLLPLSFLLYKLAFSFPQTTEMIYSRGLYPLFAYVWSGVTSALSFSIGEVGLYCLGAYAAFSVVYIPLGLLAKGKRLYTMVRRLTALICTACIIGSVFILNWAINYARQPLSISMNMPTDKYTAEELKDVTLILISRANELREKVQEDDAGVFTLSSTKQEILNSLAKEYEDAEALLYPVKSGARAKGVMAKDLLSTFETTGIYSPFTYEANVNMQMPDSYFPSTALHEYAHLQGFAREDEANFIAWYVGKDSANADFAYSAYIHALTYAINSLYASSTDGYRDAYYAISDGVLRDLKANTAYWKEFETEISQQANEVYSDYLKASGVPDGSKSYGRMLDLILAMHAKGLEL